jgi:glycosyltransferase involved in cell wall biosynthesis
VSEHIEQFRPDIVHVHNFFPLLSPAIYEVCHAAGIPVVQTLHNYRTICANGLLLRNGQSCHLCVNNSTIWGVIHRCYRNSFVGSMALGRMISVHRKRGTWRNNVDQFIALSTFSRKIFIEAGFPEDRITVKPNFVKDPANVTMEGPREGALFVGRITEGKGLLYLLEAASKYNFSLRVVGDGPDITALKKIATDRTMFLGHLSRERVFEEIRRAAVLVVPSIWYENCPVVVIEAFACATPVIGSRYGALSEMINDGVTGFLTPRADSKSLGEKISQVLTDKDLARRLRSGARREFLNRFSPEINLRQLEQIYGNAISNFSIDRLAIVFGI